MTNTKTARVLADIEKTKAKIAEQQARLRELEHKRVEIENMEIVDIVRGLRIPLDDLVAILQSLKSGDAPAPVPQTSGHVVPKSKTPEKPETDEEDENE